MDQNQQPDNIKQISIDAYSFQSETYADELKQEFQELGHQQMYSIQIENYQPNTEAKKLFQLVFDQPSENLVKFQLSESEITRDQLQFFTNLTWPKLQILRIYATNFDDDCALLLSKCNFPCLNTLSFLYCDNGDAAISLLCSGKWSKLKQMGLCRNQLTSHGLEHLGSIKQWKELQILQVDENDFRVPIQNVSELFDFPKLRHLNFRQSNLNEQIISKIDKQKLPLLQKLQINQCPISGKELFNLNKNIGWANLKQLEMGAKNIGEEQIKIGISNICQYPLLNLTRLDISFINLCKQSFRHFSKAQWNLNHFRLFECNVQEESMKLLIKFKWQNLEELYLHEDNVGDLFVCLMSLSNWPKLNTLQLKNITRLMSLSMKQGFHIVLASPTTKLSYGKARQILKQKILNQVSSFIFEYLSRQRYRAFVAMTTLLLFQQNEVESGQNL